MRIEDPPAPPAPPEGFTPPREFDDYALARPLSEGAQGTVWVAEDCVLARPVAIKFPAGRGGAAPDAAARQRFVVEARAAARVQHPNIAAVYRVGEVQGRPYLVSELVRGQGLDRLPRPLPWREALRIGVDLARGLAAAHRSGVLHGDLKPGNAVLGEDGVAKLLDFGLARLADGPDAGYTGDADGHAVNGTPLYIAPELWEGEPLSRRSDVYAFGALLFELLSGAAPFAGLPLRELAQAVATREAPALRPGDPAALPLAAVVARCLRRDPAERYGSGDELREALEALLRAQTAGPPPLGNPYRGLRAFRADHRALFFGRSTEVGVVVDRLRAEPCVIVTGDSGVGKSSLCAAGVLPAVVEGALGDGRHWAAASLVPGRAPLDALAAALAPAAGLEPATLRRELGRAPGELGRILRRALRADRGLLLLVDQLEELLTLAPPEEAGAADVAFASLAAGVPGIRVLAAVRADFLGRVSRLPRLAEDLSRVLYFLRPLSRERLRDVIVGPARATGTHFESEALVGSLVDATAQAEGGLPLLQFALAELWEARDLGTDTITEAALAQLGGVDGALARHADGVLAALPPAERAQARRMLLRLVTLEGTRARRGERELAAGNPAARAALDALVRGRLLVATDAGESSAYELAHEVLVRGWSTLRLWLREDAERREAREALARATAEWERAGRSRELLLRPAQLRAVEALGAEDLLPPETALVAASRRARRVRRRTALAVVCAIPLVIVGVWALSSAAATRTARAQLVAQERAGLSALARARAVGGEAQTLRARALRAFDVHASDAEELWSAAQADGDEADHAFADAAGALEAAVAIDPSRPSARSELADALFERALLAESWHRDERAGELVRRFALYDADGVRGRAWRLPAMLSVRSSPPGAEAVLLTEAEARSGAAGTSLGATPLPPRPLPQGSWVLVLRAPGRAEARLPFVAGRGERLDLAVPLPAAAAVPEGFVYVPPGTFLFGSSDDDETRQGFLNAQPLHPVRTGGYLVARREITYREWITFLDALPPDEQDARRPMVRTGPSSPGSVELRRAEGGWSLLLQPGSAAMVGRPGAMLRYAGRDSAAEVDWLDLPVTGISAEDLEAYAAWLVATARVPGARPCTELEWERAARGADGRRYPTGATLRPEDANYDATHGHDGAAPDAVGTHVASRSPSGIDDASGNAFELTRGLDPGTYVARGGSYWHDRKTAQLANREPTTPNLRDATLGGRMCADLAPEASFGPAVR